MVKHKQSDQFWEFVVQLDDAATFCCTFCGYKFAAATSISRIKWHLSGIKGRGVRICERVPGKVQKAALAAIYGPPQKKLKAVASNNKITNTLSTSARDQNNQVIHGEMAQQAEPLSPGLQPWMYSIIHENDPFWEFVDRADGEGAFNCKFCRFKFAAATSISRIKWHLSRIKGRGVRICEQAPENIQEAALAAIDGHPQKKLKAVGGSSNNEVTNTISTSAQDQNNQVRYGEIAQQAEPLSPGMQPWMDSITHEIDPFWEFVDRVDGGAFNCKFCCFKFAAATSISRIKWHLSGIKGRGVRICEQAPETVQEAALAAIDGHPQKKLKAVAGSSNNEVTNTVSTSAQDQNNQVRHGEMAQQAEPLYPGMQPWMDSTTHEIDPFWEFVDGVDGCAFNCKFCCFKFAAATSISRIKWHLSGIKGHGVRICEQAPENVQEAALAATDGHPQKKLKVVAGSSNNEVTNTISTSAQDQNNQVIHGEMVPKAEPLSPDALSAISWSDSPTSDCDALDLSYGLFSDSLFSDDLDLFDHFFF